MSDDADYWRIQAADVLTQLHEAEAENAALRARLDTVMHTGDMEHARMASMIGASTELLNQLALLLRQDEKYLWIIGGRPLDEAHKELKRATANVRSDADALLAELAAAREVVAAMRQIDKHVIGACEGPGVLEGGMPEPCDECGEMREIAAQSLAEYAKATKARAE